MSKTFAILVVLLVLFGAGACYVAFEWHRTTAPETRLRKGREAAQAGDYSRAGRYAQLLQDAGEASPALLIFGEMQFQRGNFEKALALLNSIRDEGEIRVQAAELSGRCLLGLNERREAERVFRFVVSERPSDIEVHRFLATIYYDQGDYARAQLHLREVARLDPNDPRPYRLIGLIHNDLNEPAEESVAAYREALRLGLSVSAEEEVRIELAECLLKLFRAQEALEVLGGLESELAYVFRAQALSQLNRGDEATRVLDEGLRRYPHHPGLAALRGVRYLADDRTDEAIRLLEPALAINTGDHQSRYQLARAYERVGRREDALKQHAIVRETQQRLAEMTELNKLAMKDPWDAGVRLRLAEVCAQTGRPDLAAMWKKAAEACSPDLGAAPRP
jgi:tetratricopeptide (TPR) repeat protein